MDWVVAARPLPSTRVAIPLSIAGVRLDVVTDDARLERRLRDYFREYDGEGPAPLEVHLRPLVIAEVPGLWHDEDPEFHGVGDSVVQRDFAARRIVAANGRTTVIAAVHPSEPDDAIHNLLRWAMPSLLLENHCLLMHSASVVFRDEGYLFYGQSGAGKSTTAAMIAAAEPLATVLGDDAGIIQCVDGRAWLHAAPLGSGYSREAPAKVKVPLKGIFSLEQANVTRCEALDGAEAMRSLLASAMTPDFAADVESRFDLALDFVVSSCGVRRLNFEKNGRFWPMISEGK